MSHPFRPLSGIALVGAFVLSGSLSAQALTVGRCNVLVDGVYTPALIVTNGDSETVHHIGTDGLTRRIVFDPQAALAWAAGLFGAAAEDIDYSDACQVSTAGASTPPPVDEEEEEEGEGEEGCGPVDGCGPVGEGSLPGDDGNDVFVLEQ